MEKNSKKELIEKTFVSFLAGIFLVLLVYKLMAIPITPITILFGLLADSILVVAISFCVYKFSNVYKDE